MSRRRLRAHRSRSGRVRRWRRCRCRCWSDMERRRRTRRDSRHRRRRAKTHSQRHGWAAVRRRRQRTTRTLWGRRSSSSRSSRLMTTMSVKCLNWLCTHDCGRERRVCRSASCVTAAASLWHCVVVWRGVQMLLRTPGWNVQYSCLRMEARLRFAVFSVSLCWHSGKERRVKMLPRHLFLYRAWRDVYVTSSINSACLWHRRDFGWGSEPCEILGNLFTLTIWYWNNFSRRQNYGHNFIKLSLNSH